MKYSGLVVVAVTACAPSLDHATITAVPQNPTPAQRQWFWDTYHPAGKGEDIISVCRGLSCNTTRKPFITLPDHRDVHDPADLAPLVAPTSRTLAEAERARRADDHRTWFGLGMVAGIVGGIALSAEGNSNGNDPMLYTGLGVALGSLLVGAAGASIEKDRAHEARMAAFGWYPHDLADNLHVCFNGVTVTPCEANTPGTPPPPPPRDPNLDQLRPR